MLKVGIIGAGAVGGTLARRLIALGHGVSIANSRGPRSLRQVAAETGATAVEMHEPFRDADVVIIAIPTGRIPELSQALKAASPSGAVVVDAGNYYPLRDGAIADLSKGVPESTWVSKQLNRGVVKAFNNIIADNLATAARPSGARDRVALPVCGDDERARSVVMKLVEALGFDAFDAGQLESSWRQQPGQPAYCSNPTLRELPLLLGRADRDKGPLNRDKGMKMMSRLPPGFPSHRLVQVARLSAGLDVWKPSSWVAGLTLAMALVRAPKGPGTAASVTTGDRARRA